MLELEDATALVAAALAEDLGSGDLTTLCTVPEGAYTTAVIVAKSDGVLCGRALAAEVFRQLDQACRLDGVTDGTRLARGDTVLSLAGPTRAVLAGERVALNFLQRLSGIATLTRRYVDAVAGTGARISDTRKTTPLLRRFEKEAVRCGGGMNHRARLDAMLLVKENHIAAAGGVGPALHRALDAARPLGLEVEIETRTFEEFSAALTFGPDRILLDHWTPEDVRRAVARRAGTATLLEVSGNLTLETVRAYAEAGADILSVGALTHSAPALDLSLLIQGANA